METGTGLPDGIFFKPKTPFWVNFGGSCNGRSCIFYVYLVYFMAIWYILRPFGIFMAIWYILWLFGIFSHLKKSSNPGSRRKLPLRRVQTCFKRNFPQTYVPQTYTVYVGRNMNQKTNWNYLERDFYEQPDQFCKTSENFWYIWYVKYIHIYICGIHSYVHADLLNDELVAEALWLSMALKKTC
jgi:hypothetical protein